jgi:hypothetical protein
MHSVGLSGFVSADFLWILLRLISDALGRSDAQSVLKCGRLWPMLIRMNI